GRCLGSGSAGERGSDERHGGAEPAQVLGEAIRVDGRRRGRRVERLYGAVAVLVVPDVGVEVADPDGGGALGEGQPVVGRVRRALPCDGDGEGAAGSEGEAVAVEAGGGGSVDRSRSGVGG